MMELDIVMTELYIVYICTRNRAKKDIHTLIRRAAIQKCHTALERWTY